MKTGLLSLVLLVVLSAVSPAFESGWIKFEKEKEVYFRPFVSLKNPKDRIVIFITEDGNIYRGRCRARIVQGPCTVTPSKKFKSNLLNITYVVVRIAKGTAPEILGNGKINRFKTVVRRY